MYPKFKLFADCYLANGLNGREAAIEAGYSEKTARQKAGALLKHPEIKAYIEEKKAERSKRMEITADTITKEWQKIAFSNIGDLHNTWIKRKDFEKLTTEQKACIQSIDTKVEKKYDSVLETDYYVEYIKVRLYDKLKALENLGKHIGYYEVDNEQSKPQVTITGMEIK